MARMLMNKEQINELLLSSRDALKELESYPRKERSRFEVERLMLKGYCGVAFETSLRPIHKNHEVTVHAKNQADNVRARPPQVYDYVPYICMGKLAALKDFYEAASKAVI